MTAPRIPVTDVAASVASVRGEIDAAVARVLDSAGFVLGAELDAFEREFSAAFGVAHTVGVANGTDALHLALRAHGLKAGELVAVPALTFFATAEAVVHAGGIPLVVDVDERTATMDPNAFAAAAGRVAAVLPVHLFGHPADIDPIAAVAREHGVTVIEDACQAHGARYKGAFAGALGASAAFSFYPTKNMPAAGDAGAITTSDAVVAERVRLLRHHAQAEKDVHDEVGYNSRLDDIQAAILRVRLRHLDAATKARRQIAGWYREALAGLPVELPAEAEWAEHVYHLYVVRCDDRDRVAAALRERGIGCTVHYGVPLDRQPAMRRIGAPPADAPVAQRIVERHLTLPMYPEMQPADVDAVAAALREATRP